MIAATYALLVLANAGAWVWALAAFHGQPALLGTALLAYVLGLRHAFDADHIAAIDNVVRKLVQRETRAEHVGLYFALGHSTIVVLASLAIAVTAASFAGGLARIAAVSAMIGTVVSATFLVVVGLANLAVLRSIWRTFVRVRHGEQSAADVDAVLRGQGVTSRLTAPLFRVVTRGWHMYPLGVLFGLGFDTATEVGLLGISASGAAGGLHMWNVMIFPALFTAGMTLVDTTDSVLMVRAYRWAFIRPSRKLWYNLTMTGASVAVALLIGGTQALDLVAERLALEGAFWRLVSRWNDDLPSLGGVVVAIFLAAFVISAIVYRWKRFDDVPVG